MNKQQEVFTDILDKNKGLIYKIVNAYCAEISERADLIQEIILQLWSSFDHYDENYKLSTWIYRVALNTAISHHRKTRKTVGRANMLDNSAMNTIPAEDPYVEDQNLMLLNQFIQELKEIDKAIILLYLDKLSQKEISEITGLSPSNVGTRINRIKDTLRSKFSNNNQHNNGR